MKIQVSSDGEEFSAFSKFSFRSRNSSRIQNRGERKKTSSIFQLAGSSRGTSRSKMTPVLFACAILAAFLCKVQAISSSWRPIVASHADAGILHQEASIFGNAPTQTLYDVDSPHHLLLPHDRETCPLYKVAMAQQLYFEVGHWARLDGFSYRMSCMFSSSLRFTDMG